MNKLAIIVVFGIIILFGGMSNAYASTLSCFQVDGMAIFGYKYGEWKFIGAIANEFDSDSIANEFGAGNEFRSDSIFNEFGNFGSEFSSYSAFNEFASKPPIIVNNDYKFVGYLTINDFKTPNINTYEAIACAKNSFRSFSNSDLEDTIFKNIPSGGYSGPSGYSQQELENLLKSICPANSTYVNGQCTCNDGYTANGDICVSYTQNCQLKYGSNSYGDKQYCYCSTGYEFNSDNTACVQSLICPTNSTKLNNSCVCSDGFVLKNGQCITYTEDCRLTFGDHVIGRKGNTGNSFCDCDDGYMWNPTQTACAKVEAKSIQPLPIPTKPTTEIVNPPEETKKEQVVPVVKNQEEEENIFEETTTTPSERGAEKKNGSQERQDFFSMIFSSIKSFFTKLFK